MCTIEFSIKIEAIKANYHYVPATKMRKRPEITALAARTYKGTHGGGGEGARGLSLITSSNGPNTQLSNQVDDNRSIVGSNISSLELQLVSAAAAAASARQFLAAPICMCVCHLKRAKTTLICARSQSGRAICLHKSCNSLISSTLNEAGCSC